MENNFLIKPYITEKTFDMASALNKYVFFTNDNINKIEVKKYIEKKYKVKVININSLTKPGKKKVDWKKNKKYRKQDLRKYVVQLKKGDKIAEFLNN